MTRETENKNFKSGMVSIVGRPNVGKSTLLNKIIGEKVAIVSPVPQTTRNQVRGIYTDERGQIVFIDTPGVHIIKDRLDQFMNKAAYETTTDADCIVYLVDANDFLGREEEEIARRIAGLDVPVILGLNKVDAKGEKIPEYISLWERARGKPVQEMEKFTLLPLSGKTGINVEKLLDIIFTYLPPGPALYPQDTISDVPQRMAIADIIREKLFMIMRQELPHAIAVVVDDIQPKRQAILHIRAAIIVERPSQRAIVIGKKGEALKRIGTLARTELEGLLNSKIFLELYVKDKKDWRENNALLQEMGYEFF